MTQQEDSRVDPAMQLFNDAGSLFSAWRHQEALTKYEAAEPLFRGLMQDHPEDSRAAQTLGALLYSKGMCFAVVGRLDDAIAALGESEQIYAELPVLSGDTRKLIADVRARKGQIESQRGRGASAVVLLDSALSTYQRILGEEAYWYEILDVVRVASLNAGVLLMHGDPNLAVISADFAIRFYLSHVQELNQRPDLAHLHAPFLCSAARTAVVVHAVHNRIEIAAAAADTYMQTARSIAQTQRPADISHLAEALAWMGILAQARGEDAEAKCYLAEARTLDGAEVLKVEAIWQFAKKGRHPLLITVASALTTAVQAFGPASVSAELEQAMAFSPLAPISPLVPSSKVFTSSARCPGDVALARAQELAELATALIPTAPDAGLRLGLEAHYVFSAASKDQTATLRHRFSDWGVPWARVLLACSRTYRDRGEIQMAEDLIETCLGVAQGLIPFAADVPEVRQLLDEIETYQQGPAVRAEKEAVVQDQEPGKVISEKEHPTNNLIRRQKTESTKGTKSTNKSMSCSCLSCFSWTMLWWVHYWKSPKDTQMKDTTQKDSQISKADALLDLGRQQNDNHQFSIAVNTLQEALELYQQYEDLGGIITAQKGLGFAHRNLHQPDQAIRYYQQALELGQRYGAQPSFMAGLLQNFGIAYNENFEFEKALECFQKALLLFRNLQDHRGEANALFNQGLSHHYLSHTRQANELFQQVIQICRSLRDTKMEANFNKMITFLENYHDKK